MGAKSLLGLFVALTLIGVACEAAPTPNPPSPTPDVGLFGKGEAIAIVKSGLSLKKSKLPTEIDCMSFLKLFYDEPFKPQWIEQYQGKGVWLVSLLGKETIVAEGKLEVVAESGDFEPDAQWEVYEHSLTVNPGNTFYNSILEILGC